MSLCFSLMGFPSARRGRWQSCRSFSVPPRVDDLCDFFQYLRRVLLTPSPAVYESNPVLIYNLQYRLALVGSCIAQALDLVGRAMKVGIQPHAQLGGQCALLAQPVGDASMFAEPFDDVTLGHFTR